MEKGPKVLFNPDQLSLGNSAGPSASLPPAGLYLPKGEIRNAWRTTAIPFAGKRKGKPTFAQRAGLAYQKRIATYLTSRDDQWSVVAGPWYCFDDDTPRRHWCQPDFLLEDVPNKTTIIVEAKLRWTDAAWWQLEKLYLPVLQRVAPDVSLLRLCICKSYDPAISAPGPVNLISDLVDIQPDCFNVLVCK